MYLHAEQELDSGVLNSEAQSKPPQLQTSPLRVEDKQVFDSEETPATQS